MNNNFYNQVYNNEPQIPAHNHGVASLVLGIVSLVAALGWMITAELGLCLAGLVFAIVGACMANNAKKKGNFSGICKAGRVLSVIGIVANSIFFGLFALCGGCALCASCFALSAMM